MGEVSGSFPHVQFRIYPERRRKHWYKVFILPDKRSMWAFWREQCRRTGVERPKGRYDFLAQVTSWRRFTCRGKRCTPHPNVGQALFCLRSLTSGIISHEMTHAALYFVAHTLRRGRFDAERDDERLALVQGNLNRQMWCHYYRLRKAGKFRRLARFAKRHAA